MSRDRTRLHDQAGVAATWMLVAMIGFMFAAAAVAVDLSNFFEDARYQQNAADFACLAGIRHLPEDPNEAYKQVEANVVANLAEYDADDLRGSPAPDTSWQPAGSDGWEVAYTHPDGDTDWLQVHIHQASPTTFARWMGIGSALVGRTATCRVASPAGHDLPLGVLPGAFDGALKTGGECGSTTGNCQVLRIPREDVSGSGDQIRYNVALGVQRELEIWDGSDAHCNDVTPCNIVSTEPGHNAGPVSDGLIGEFSGIQGLLRSPLGDRITDPPGNLNPPVNGEHWDFMVNEGRIVTDGTTTVDWGDEYPGEESVVLPKVTQLPACTHPRLTRVPVVIRHTDEGVEWPTGTSQPMRIIGFYSVWVEEPYDPGYLAADGPPAAGGSHFQGSSGTANQISAVAFDASEALCTDSGGAIVDYDPDAAKLWRLVSNDGP